MRKIKIFEHVSLDGVMQHENDEHFSHANWSAPYRSPAGLAMLMESQGTPFDLLLGRRTYDVWSTVWPKAGNHPSANGINNATKYVATHRPESLEWGPVKSLGADIVEGIRALKATTGPDVILWGSSTLIPVLLTHGLVDELVLITYPILLGRGKRFYPATADACELAFVSAKTTPTDVHLNTYRYVGPLKAQPSA